MIRYDRPVQKRPFFRESKDYPSMKEWVLVVLWMKLIMAHKNKIASINWLFLAVLVLHILAKAKCIVWMFCDRTVNCFSDNWSWIKSYCLCPSVIDLAIDSFWSLRSQMICSESQRRKSLDEELAPSWLFEAESNLLNQESFWGRNHARSEKVQHFNRYWKYSEFSSGVSQVLATSRQNSRRSQDVTRLLL
jgi:hypothetical protein